MDISLLYFYFNLNFCGFPIFRETWTDLLSDGILKTGRFVLYASHQIY